MSNKVSAVGAKGLVTSERRTDLGKDGYAVRTNNVLIRRAGVWEPRFGLEALGAIAANVTRLWYDTLNANVVRGGSGGNLLQKYAAGAWVNLDTARRYSGLQSGNGLTWVLSNAGLRHIDEGNSTTDIGYVPTGLDPTLDDIAPIFGSTYLPDRTSVAYRIVWGIEKADRFLLGAPSGRVVLSNNVQNTPVSVQLTFALPDEITSAYFYQVYRTEPQANNTLGVVDPGDDMYLVYEDFTTPDNRLSRTVQIYDRVPVGAGGASLYTSQREEGDENGNYPCDCITGANGEGVLSTYADCVFANGYQPRSSFDLYLLAVGTRGGLNAYDLGVSYGATLVSGSPNVTVTSMPANMAPGMWIDGPSIPDGATVLSASGTTIVMSANATGTTGTIVTGDQLVIAGVTYRAGRTENTASGIFLVSANIVPSIAIRETMESFIRVFNTYSANTLFYANNLSGPDELGTPVHITAVADRASSYTIQAFGNTAAWFPGIAAVTTMISKGDPSLLTWSKPGLPHAWPLINTIEMPASARILTHVGLRGALIVFTTEGIYRVSGEYGAFALDLLDGSSIPVSSVTNPGAGVVVAENVAYALCNKGFVAVTETSAQVIQSTPDQLINSAPYVSQLSVSIGDNLIFVPQSYGTFVYHVNFGCWTSFDKSYSCGVYDRGTAKMLLQDGTQTRRERHAQYEASSLFDESVAGVISSISGLVAVVTSTPPQLSPGDVIAQGAYLRVITGVSGLNLTLESVADLIPGAMDYLTGYTSEVMFAPIAAGLGMSKMLMEGNILFDAADTAPGTMGSANHTGLSRVVTSIAKTDLDDTERTGTGVVASIGAPHMHRFSFSAESKRCNVFSVGVRWRTCANKTRLIGIDVSYDQGTERTGRR